MKVHLGVYGIEVINNELLCIFKNRGPYINRYDLPGGTIEKQEGIIEALKRELIEETGRKIISFKTLGTFDFFIPNEDNSTTHHIAIMYFIESEKNLYFDHTKETNDSIGFDFIPFSKISADNASPLVYKIKNILYENKLNYNTVYYDKWEIKNNI